MVNGMAIAFRKGKIPYYLLAIRNSMKTIRSTVWENAAVLLVSNKIRQFISYSVRFLCALWLVNTFILIYFLLYFVI